MATNTFLVEKALDKAIRGIAAIKDPRCAVAFLGSDAATIFKGGKAQIICNLTSGSTNPAAVRELLTQGHEVRQNNRLHAKVYIGTKKALIASANLSANGLGLQDGELARWIEAGAYTDDVGSVVSWFENLWDDRLQTRAISSRDLQAAEKLWRQRRSVKPTLDFLEFDAHAIDSPLISWWRPLDYKINPKYIGKSRTEESQMNDSALDDFYIAEASVDSTILTPGTWLLWWRMNNDGWPSGRTKCSWFRAGPLLKDYVKFDGSKNWGDAILAEGVGVPEPFDCADPLFNKVFRKVIMLKEFDELRIWNHSGSFLEPRLKLMRRLWPVLQEAYREELAAENGR